jgi:hypothetical protein
MRHVQKILWIIVGAVFVVVSKQAIAQGNDGANGLTTQQRQVGAVAIPAFMKNAQKAKTSKTNNLTTKPRQAGAVAIPAFMKNAQKAKTSKTNNLTTKPRQAGAVAIPAFMKNAQKAKTSQGLLNGNDALLGHPVGFNGPAMQGSPVSRGAAGSIRIR